MMDSLSPLEEDFFSDLAADDHGLWELFAFVRLHHPALDDAQVLATGEQLLEKWERRGWLTLVSRQGVPLPFSVAQIMVGLSPEALGASDEAPWLRLTEKALQDRPLR